MNSEERRHEEEHEYAQWQLNNEIRQAARESEPKPIYEPQVGDTIIVNGYITGVVKKQGLDAYGFYFLILDDGSAFGADMESIISIEKIEDTE